jgi:hypothetical protein
MYSTRGATLTLKGSSLARATDRLRAAVPPTRPKVEASPKPVTIATPVAPTETAAASQAKRSRKRRAREPGDPAVRQKIEALLRERFPAAFCGPPRVPLAIGIHRQILDVVGSDISKEELGSFLGWWTLRWDYLDAIAHGEMRRNLDGSLADAPAAEEQRSAAKVVYGLRADEVLARIEAQRDGDA